MADISKCTGILTDKSICPLKNKCYRYTVKSSKFKQSWMCTPGYYKNGKFVCNLKWIEND